jgi:hypothetical protein
MSTSHTKATDPVLRKLDSLLPALEALYKDAADSGLSGYCVQSSWLLPR